MSKKPKLIVYHNDGHVTRPVKEYPTCMECDKEYCADTETSGLLADLCDILFDDPDRASDHGYEGVIERAREVMDCAMIDPPKGLGER